MTPVLYSRAGAMRRAVCKRQTRSKVHTIAHAGRSRASSLPGIVSAPSAERGTDKQCGSYLPFNGRSG
jgi:hypothetical protein